jgi:hypothetical protein
MERKPGKFVLPISLIGGGINIMNNGIEITVEDILAAGPCVAP